MNKQGWEIKKLGDICNSIVRGPFGSSLKKEFFIPKSLNSYKVYEQKNAIKADAFIGTYYIDKIKFQELRRFAIKAHDVIMSCSGTIGKLYVIPDNAELGVINQALLKFTLNTDIIIHNFFLYYLNSIISDIEKKGSGIQNIGSIKFIKELKVPTPEILVQNQIVKELDTLQAIITKKKAQLDELDKLAQATFYDMFGDPLNNEKKLHKEKLGKVATLRGGFAFKSTDYADTGIRLVQISNVHSDNLIWDIMNFLPSYYIKEYADYMLREDDIVMAMTRPIIKSLNSVKIATIKKQDLPCFLNQRVGKFIYDKQKLNGKYLEYFCKQQFFKDKIDSYSSTSLQPNVSSKQVEAIEILLPPLSLQNQFAKRIEAIEKQKALINQSIAETQLLFDSAMDNYFN